ncbi:MAG TPA: glycoside hydrolase family 66 protein, partial [Bacilli bacterium]
MMKMKPYIKDVYPLKAQFLSNEHIELAVELYNPSSEFKHLDIKVRICDLNKEIENIEYISTIQAQSDQTITIAVSPKEVEFKGYGVDVYLYSEEDLLHVFSSSFDVVSDWRKSTRYGFLSEFQPKELGDKADVMSMNKLHLNLVMFYDWMYRHEELVSPENEYSDLMGKISSLEVIQEKIDLCHQYGMKAMAYGAVYAASKDFYEKHRDWALYDSHGRVMDFINIFYIMNTSDQSPWHNHIIDQFNNAVVQLDFDGIHMDTYGSPKIAISKLNNVDKIERLEEHFPILINNTRKVLEQSKEDICLIFNNVGNWPVNSVARAEQDVIYIEVWNPNERYHHIQQIVYWAKYFSGGKPVILAAYLKPFRVNKKQEKLTAEGIDHSADIEEANFSALILTALITAIGGYHLLLGEEKGILTQGYYVDYSKTDDHFMREIRNYYDFMIRYANIFFDDELKDVSMTHVDIENHEYVFANGIFSSYGEPGKVWTIIREKPGRKTISFINLSEADEDYWNEGKKKPGVLENI